MASDSRSWESPRNKVDTVSPDRTTWIQERVAWLWSALVFSAIYIAVIAALEVVLVMAVLGLPMNLAPLAVGCITFTIYANDRLVDIESDAISNPQRTAFVQRHRRSLSAFAALAYGLAVALAVYNGPVALALTLTPGAAWVLYAVDWTPSAAGSIRRLKEVLLVNSILVALAWAVTVVVMPIAFADAPLSPASWLLVVYFAVGTFIGTEISNVRDINSDVDSSVSTLPSNIGLAWTKYVLFVLALLGIGVLAFGWLHGIFDALATGALSVGLLGMMAIVALLDSQIDEATLSVWGECVRPLSLAILLVGIAI